MLSYVLEQKIALRMSRGYRTIANKTAKISDLDLMTEKKSRITNRAAVEKKEKPNAKILKW